MHCGLEGVQQALGLLESQLREARPRSKAFDREAREGLAKVAKTSKIDVRTLRLRLHSKELR
jgi:hypothetical protein